MSTLIISADLKPRYVINQIILLAVTRNSSINVLCVSSLNNRLNRIVPFSCFCLCVLKNDDNSTELRPIVDWCRSIIEIHHPINQQYFNIADPNQPEPQVNADSDPMNAANAPNIEMADVSFEKMYLMKAVHERAFVPTNTTTTKTFASSNDFISLDDNTSDKRKSMVSDADAVTIDAEVRSKIDDIKIAPLRWESKAVKKEFYRLQGKEEGTNQSYLTQYTNRSKANMKNNNKWQKNSPKILWGNKYNDVKVNKVQSNINKNKTHKNVTNKKCGMYVKINKAIK